MTFITSPPVQVRSLRIWGVSYLGHIQFCICLWFWAISLAHMSSEFVAVEILSFESSFCLFRRSDCLFSLTATFQIQDQQCSAKRLVSIMVGCVPFFPQCSHLYAFIPLLISANKQHTHHCSIFASSHSRFNFFPIIICFDHSFGHLQLTLRIICMFLRCI